jgi:hypothetical protein
MADGKAPVRWIGPWKVAQAWPMVRRPHLLDVARANSVPTDTRTGAGTYGPTHYTAFDAEAVSQLATRLEHGDAVVDPSWLRDTPEGRRGQWITARDTVLFLLFFALIAAACCGIPFLLSTR